MALKDMNYKEGAMALLSGMARLTVLRDAMREPPMVALHTLLALLAQQDALSASDSYYALSHALLTGGYRRVSGDLFRDFLLWLLLERENDFSLSAAQSCWDEPLCFAMRADMKQLEPFFELNSVLLKRWVGECNKEQRGGPHQQKDSISLLSSAAWAGSGRPALSSYAQAAPEQQKKLQPVALDESTLPSWRYQNDAQQEEQLFAVDTTLEELYYRLDSAADKGMLLDDIWSFHATYGTGMFIRNRFFTLRADGTLCPLSQELLPKENADTFYHQQRGQGLRNAIRFMRGEHAQNMLLTGGPGTGKTTQIFSLCRELPELRLICCPPGTYGALLEVIPKLMAQPLMFAVFLDDFDSSCALWPQVKHAIAPTGVQPDNLLLIAAAQSADSSFFPLHVQLPPPQLKDFIELVQGMLLREGREINFDSIQNACIDYAAAKGASGTGTAGTSASGMGTHGMGSYGIGENAGEKNQVNPTPSPFSFRLAEIIAEALNTDGV